MKQWIVRTLALLGAFVLLGTDVPGGSAAAAERMVLQLKWRHQFQFAGFYAAQHQGYYRDEGLAVEIREGTPANPSLQALLSGDAHVAVSDSEALVARLQGKPVVALAVIFQHSPYLLLTRDRRITRPADLAGRTVMISASQGAAELKALFVREGVPLASVRFVEHTRTVADLISGHVDAMAAYATDQFREFRRSGTAQPGVINPLHYGIDFYGDALVTTEEQVSRRPERIAAFRRASIRGWDYAFGHVDEMIDLILAMDDVAERGITREFLQHEAAVMRELVQPMLVEIGHMNPGRWRQMADLLVQLGMASKTSSLRGFLYDPEPDPWWSAHATKIIAVSLGLILASLVLILYLRAVVRRRAADVEKEASLRYVSEERFRAIYDSVNDAIFIHDKDTGAILDVNQKMCDLFGISREEALRATVGDLSSGEPPYTQDDAVVRIRKAAAGQPQLFEWCCRRRDGNLFWVEVNMKRAVIGGRERVLVVARDITERNRSTEALAESLENYRMVVSSISASIWRLVFDEHGRLQTARLSEGGDRLLGLPAGTLDGSPDAFFSSVHPEDLAAVRRAFSREPWAAGGRHVHEYRVRRTDGELRWFRSAGSASRGPNGALLVFGTTEDITEQKRSEQALLREKAFSDAIIDSLPGIFYICDESGRLVRWNSNEREVTGYTLQELSQMNVLQLFAADREVVARKMREVFDDGRTVVEASLATKSGALVPFYLTGHRMEVNDRRYIVGVGIDISERRKLEQQLHQAQKMEAIGILAGGLAHDFNNILSAIIGYASLLRFKMPPEDPLRHSVEQILASTERAALLTRSLLSFSRKQVTDLRQQNVNEIVAGVHAILARLIGEDIDLRIDLSKEPLPVHADKVQLEQVLMNLATNARDAMPEGGSLQISTAPAVLDADDGGLKSGSYAVISVSDTGTGMDPVTRGHLFEPFYTTKEQGKGTGLGLAIAYGIISKHAGAITVSSEPGRGTQFRIYLPLLAGSAGSSAAVRPAEPQGGTETILLVEDDPSVRRMTASLLEEFGYFVLEAGDGAHAVRLFQEHQARIRLVLCDVIMPGMNGKSTCGELLKIRPGVKVIYMSGYTADIIAQKGVLEEGTNFIPKPLNPPDLLDKVRTVMDQP